MSAAKAPRVIRLLPVAQIRIGGDRMRAVDPMWAAGMAEVMLDPDAPMLPPVEVYQQPGRSGWEVIDGAHRLTGAKMADLETIEAIVLDNSALRYRTLEVQRNLFNRSLDVFEQAAHVSELYYLERRKRGLDDSDDPRKLGGRPTKTLREMEKELGANLPQVSPLRDSVASVLGMDVDKVKRLIALHRSINRAALAVLRQSNHRILNVADQIMKLAKVEYDAQPLVAEMMVNGTAKSVAEASYLIGSGAVRVAAEPAAIRRKQLCNALARFDALELIGTLEELDVPHDNARKIALYLKKWLKPEGGK